MRVRLFTIFSLFAILLIACSSTSTGGIEVTNAMVVLPGVEAMSSMDGMNMSSTLAGYFQIRNDSSVDDRLLKVTCDFADAMLHETRMEGDVATMAGLPYVDVPAGSTVEFKTGGMHVMLMNASQILKIGDTVNLTLLFEKAGSLTVTANVMGH